MDEAVALLADRVAAAADAWLRDPLDAQVYGRLVVATLAWRRVARPTLEGLDGQAAPDPQAPDADDAADIPPRLGDALGAAMTELHLRQSAPHDVPDT